VHRKFEGKEICRGNLNLFYRGIDVFFSHLKRREEEEAMKAFEEAMKHDSTDEEAKRKFYISKIRWWTNTAFEDLDYLHGKDDIEIIFSNGFLL
jgi:hypothetical protein